MSTRWKVTVAVTLGIVALILVTGIIFPRSPNRETVHVAFLGYTNGPGGLYGVLEVSNLGKERIARNSCRISPEPAEEGYWYAAQVPSHRLEPGDSEKLVVSFDPRPMTRWRATIVYVRNPTTLQFHVLRGVDWLKRHGWAPSALRRWRDGLTGRQTTTDWILVPATNGVPNPSVETNRPP